MTTLTHEQFLQQYVLNRANTMANSFNPIVSITAGEDAWQTIREIVSLEARNARIVTTE